MTDTRRWVLIGDPTRERFELLHSILDDEFMATAILAQDYEEFRENLPKHRWALLLIAHDLPWSPTGKYVLLREYFNHLRFEALSINKGCIVSVPEPAELEWVDPPPAHIHVTSTTPSQAEREHIATELGTLLPRAPRLPDLVLVDSPSLNEQVRLLSEKRRLDDGMTVLRHLTRKLFHCQQVEIEKLGQGMSGAKVFRVRPSPSSDSQEFVLKLSPASDLWKILLEVERYAKAKATLEVKDYVIHFPRLVEAEAPAEIQGQSQPNLVQYKTWYAICYDFLGGKKFGKLIDIETVITASSDRLEQKTKGADFSTLASDTLAVREHRVQLFELTMDWLCRNWYMRDRLINRQLREVWNTEDADDKYPAMPPYQLGGKNKGFILSFLDSSLSGIGEHFFDSWAEYRQRVWVLVEKNGGRTGLAFLDRQLQFIISPAHGDLNGTNILLWLDQAYHPFLIDFPFYQEQGHALQDFARLEVEIKLSLMDRQADSSYGALPARDLTFSQLHLWKEMEDHLLSDNWGQPKDEWAADGFKDNVNLCLRLIQLLRLKAMAVQQQLAGAETCSFKDEYAPPLLYHTVRAVGYSSLSIFKRLLAVYSAGRLLTV